MDAIEALLTRRSYGRLKDPAPSNGDLRTIIAAAAAAPDHGELRPFRFIVVKGAGLGAFADVLEEAYFRRCTENGEAPVRARSQKERTKLNRAPLIVVVAAIRQSSEKIPWADQRDAAVAAAENILIASHALGYGGMWRTGHLCEDEYVKKAVGLTPDDSIVGFLYLGTPHSTKEPRPVDLEGLVTEYHAYSDLTPGGSMQTS